jgi:hypothetical protein
VNEWYADHICPEPAKKAEGMSDTPRTDEALDGTLFDLLRVSRELELELAEVLKDAERYRKAVIDLSERGWGVKRPKWLIKIIDAAVSSGQVLDNGQKE